MRVKRDDVVARIWMNSLTFFLLLQKLCPYSRNFGFRSWLAWTGHFCVPGALPGVLPTSSFNLYEDPVR